jgi:hypothetical protein
VLLDRLIAACTSVLPDATVIVHGSLALGDYVPGKSDVDLLVLSDAPADALVVAAERAWKQEPGNFDLRVVRYAVAAAPTRTPRMALGVGAHGDQNTATRSRPSGRPPRPLSSSTSRCADNSPYRRDRASPGRVGR